MDILERLNKTTNFSQSEKIIYNYIINEQEGIDDFTISELSDKLFISKSTFVRFSKKLGYYGWVEFKKAYLSALKISQKEFSSFDYNFPFDKSDSNINIANKLQVIKRGTIEETFNFLTSNSIKKSIELMMKCKNIHIFAEGYSRISSQDFVFRMNRIGKFVSNSNEEGLTYISKLLDETDLAIVISYSGKTKSVLRAAQILNTNNVPIISITTNIDNPIKALSTCNFYLPNKEDTYDKISNFSSMDATRYILDVLYSCYFNKDYNHYLNDRVEIAKVEYIK